MNPDPITISEAAKMLRVTYNSIHGAILAGRLRAYRFGANSGAIRIYLADLEAYRESCATNVPQRQRQITKPKRQPSASFKRLNADRLFEAWRTEGEFGSLSVEESS
jgi:excisionase family DNA binding protein